jgi:hypothetical protein
MLGTIEQQAFPLQNLGLILPFIYLFFLQKVDVHKYTDEEYELK